MKETMTSGAIFDIDGTLVDSRAGHLESWMAAFKHFGLQVEPDDLMKHFGQKAPTICHIYAPSEWTDDQKHELVDFKRDYFGKNIASTLKTFPKVFDLLDYLSKEQYKLALLTSASRTELENYKTLLQYDRYFTAAISGDDVADSKPSPEGVLMILKELALPSTDVIVLGDSPHDMKAGISAGTKTIGLTSGGYGFQELLEAGAEKIFSDIEDIFSKIPISLWFF